MDSTTTCSAMSVGGLYREYAMHAGDEAALLDLLADMHAYEVAVRDERQRKAVRNELKQRL